MAVQTDSNSLPPAYKSYGIENRNFLSPIGFQFTIDRLRGVEFFCQAATIPAIAMGSPSTGTSINKIRHPGDELEYDDLVLRFIVDENMKNYYQVHDWMKEITTPINSSQFGFNRGTLPSQNPIKRRVPESPGLIGNQWKSECSLFILSSNYRPVAEFVFHDAFPIELAPVQFDSTVNDIVNLTCEIRMAYNYFTPLIRSAATATDESMKSTNRITEMGVDIDISSP